VNIRPRDTAHHRFVDTRRRHGHGLTNLWTGGPDDYRLADGQMPQSLNVKIPSWP